MNYEMISDKRPKSQKIKFETIEVLHEKSFKNTKKMLDERLTTLKIYKRWTIHKYHWKL